MKFYFLLILAFAPCTAQSSMIDSLLVLEKNAIIRYIMATAAEKNWRNSGIKGKGITNKFLVTEYKDALPYKEKRIEAGICLFFVSIAKEKRIEEYKKTFTKLMRAIAVTEQDKMIFQKLFFVLNDAKNWEILAVRAEKDFSEIFMVLEKEKTVLVFLQKE